MSSESHVQLYVRAGRDGSSYGACPFCHRILMELLYKAEAGVLSVTMTTINLNTPPEDFRDLSNRIPVLCHEDRTVVDNEDIVDYIRKNFPTPGLLSDEKTAVNACMDLFSKFSYYVKMPDSSPKALLAELKKVDEYLASSGNRFLCGNELSDLDCFTLAKLQQIRVTCRALKQWEIPDDLEHLWRYLAEAYKLDIFRKACPPDEEIIYHWGQKWKGNMSSLEPNVRSIVANTLDSNTKTYTFTVPTDHSGSS